MGGKKGGGGWQCRRIYYTRGRLFACNKWSGDSLIHPPVLSFFVPSSHPPARGRNKFRLKSSESLAGDNNFWERFDGEVFCLRARVRALLQQVPIVRAGFLRDLFYCKFCVVLEEENKAISVCSRDKSRGRGYSYRGGRKFIW